MGSESDSQGRVDAFLKKRDHAGFTQTDFESDFSGVFEKAAHSKTNGLKLWAWFLRRRVAVAQICAVKVRLREAVLQSKCRRRGSAATS